MGPLIAYDFVLDADDKRRNVAADEIRARFHEMASAPAWKRREIRDEIFDKPRGVGNVRANTGSGSR